MFGFENYTYFQEKGRQLSKKIHFKYYYWSFQDKYLSCNMARTVISIDSDRFFSLSTRAHSSSVTPSTSPSANIAMPAE